MLSKLLPQPDAGVSLIAVKRIDSICVQFERAWKQGNTPDLADYLNETLRSEQPYLLAELLKIELYYRSAAEPRPDAEDYAARFPEHEVIVREIFRRQLPSESATNKPAAGHRHRSQSRGLSRESCRPEITN